MKYRIIALIAMLLVVIITVGIVIIILISIYILLSNKKKRKLYEEEGIVADAVVSREIEHRYEDDDAPHTSYTYHVKFRTRDGEEVEAQLDDYRKSGLRTGDSIRIKYLPGNTKKVLMDKG